MPIYVYEVINLDGTPGDTFEVIQRMSEDPLQVHPDSGVPVRRVIGAPSIGGMWSDAAMGKSTDDMNPQPASGLGNILVAVGENSVDMLPFRLSESRNGDLFIRFGCFDFCASAFERTEYVIGVGWLRQKVNSA